MTETAITGGSLGRLWELVSAEGEALAPAVASAPGEDTLGRLDAAAYARLGQTTDRLVEGLRGDAISVTSETGLLTVFFSERPVTDYTSAQAADRDAFAAFWNAMLERGIYLPPSPFEAWFPSLAHSDEQVERTVEAAAESFAIAGAG